MMEEMSPRVKVDYPPYYWLMFGSMVTDPPLALTLPAVTLSELLLMFGLILMSPPRFCKRFDPPKVVGPLKVMPFISRHPTVLPLTPALVLVVELTTVVQAA